PAFGHGDFKMLAPSNNKVLAFTRTYETQTVLVVINLSRFSQAVELDLSGYAGYTPEDAFGHSRFPVIHDFPYQITLGPNTFYWLLLTPPEVAGVAGGERLLPSIRYDGTREWWYSTPGVRFLDRDLTSYMRGCRWFRSKARNIINVQLLDIFDFESEGTKALIIAVNFSEGSRDVYAVPLKTVGGDEARKIEVEYPAAVVARVSDDGDLLVDSTASHSFHQSLFQLITGKRALNGQAGRLASSQSIKLSELGDLEAVASNSRLLKVEQSNSSMVFDESVFMKLFRKLDEGLNPDLEVTKQLTEHCGFENVPRYLGDIQYSVKGQDPAALAMAQAYTTSEQDGWAHTLAAVGRYFDRILGDPSLTEPGSFGLWDTLPKPYLEVIEGVHLEFVRLLGERTAEMHLALAADHDSPDFAPELFTLQHQRSIYQSIRSESKVTFALLNRVQASLDASTQELASQVEAKAEALNRSHEYLLQDTIHAQKIRIHGDYHLGQTLYTGKDFVILDFEGEPARSIGERRLKRSALIDVAGMLRSFHYAAHYGLVESRSIAVDDRPGLPSFADIWATRAGQVFLGAYLERAGTAQFVPIDRADLRLLLRSFMIVKAMYELRYELNNRPKWVPIPLRGLLQMAAEG
ncbi:MAG: putative maltokinase, partial [Verrucomicrobia bacterium]|nr:putative maltokinase [Verrucomicrobiota bacterium]